MVDEWLGRWGVLLVVTIAVIPLAVLEIRDWRRRNRSRPDPRDSDPPPPPP